MRIQEVQRSIVRAECAQIHRIVSLGVSGGLQSRKSNALAIAGRVIEALVLVQAQSHNSHVRSNRLPCQLRPNHHRGVGIAGKSTRLPADTMLTFGASNVSPDPPKMPPSAALICKFNSRCATSTVSNPATRLGSRSRAKDLLLR